MTAPVRRTARHTLETETLGMRRQLEAIAVFDPAGTGASS